MAVDFQALDFIRSKNRIVNHERKKSEQQKRHELFIDARKSLDNLANAYNKATNPDFKKLYKEKWFELVKVYAKKIQRKDGSYKLSIRTGTDGKLYNPMSIYGKEKASTLLDNVCKSNDKFKTVNEKTFTWYTQFLKTKNMAHLYNAEREAE